MFTSVYILAVGEVALQKDCSLFFSQRQNEVFGHMSSEEYFPTEANEIN